MWTVNLYGIYGADLFAQTKVIGTVSSAGARLRGDCLFEHKKNVLIRGPYLGRTIPVVKHVMKFTTQRVCLF